MDARQKMFNENRTLNNLTKWMKASGPININKTKDNYIANLNVDFGHMNKIGL